jgi:hypothetical protein
MSEREMQRASQASARPQNRKEHELRLAVFDDIYSFMAACGEVDSKGSQEYWRAKTFWGECGWPPVSTSWLRRAIEIGRSNEDVRKEAGQ